MNMRENLIFLLFASFLNNQSEETVANVMKRPYYMDALLAKKFGVIDKVSAYLHYVWVCLFYV